MQFFGLAETIILATAISLDAFAASFAYGGKRIRIPFLSVLIINLVCSLILGVSLFTGAIISEFIPEFITVLIGIAILLILGILKFFDSGTIKNHDADNSKIISAGEAVALSVALSIDGLAVGIGAALVDTNVWAVISATFIIGVFAVTGGSFLGNKIAGRFNLSWISGLLLIGLAISRLF